LIKGFWETIIFTGSMELLFDIGSQACKFPEKVARNSAVCFHAYMEISIYNPSKK